MTRSTTLTEAALLKYVGAKKPAQPAYAVSNIDLRDLFEPLFLPVRHDRGGLAANCTPLLKAPRLRPEDTLDMASRS